MPDEVGGSGEQVSQIQHVSIKVPQFMETSVDGWFDIIEAQFELANVSRSSTRFFHVISALPADIVCSVSSEARASKSYEKIKEEILSLYEKSKAEMLDKLMDNTTIHGRPSVALREMEHLAKKLNINDDVVKHKFLQKMPSGISTVLAAQTDLTLSQVGKLAENLTPYMTQSAHSSINQVVSEEKRTHSNNTHSSEKYYSSQAVPIGVRAFNAKQRPSICRGHLYYANKSRSCKPWCKWPNKQNVTMKPSSRTSSPCRSEN